MKIDFTTAEVVERPTCSETEAGRKSLLATDGGDDDAEHDALNQAGEYIVLH